MATIESTDELTMDEITREVESVRQQRYEKQKAAESDKDSRLSQLFGIWSDGPTAEEVIDKIRSSRTSGVTRDITPLHEAQITDFVANLGTDLGLPADFDEKEAYRKHLEEKHLSENDSGSDA